MSTGVTNYKCPACTGPLHFVGESGMLECDYCASKYPIAEIEALYADKEAQAVQAQQKIDAQREDQAAQMAAMGMEWSDEEAAGMKAYNCPSCGAQLICDATTAATSCPYCGNPTVIPGQFSGGLKPELIIPFKLDKEDAKKALKKYYNGKKFLPNAFKDENHIDEIKGVYVPFWLFDCTAAGGGTYNGEISHVSRVGDYEITEKQHFVIEREGYLGLEKVPVDASTKMPDEHMDAIEPFDYSEFKPFSTAYLPGFLADKYDVNKESSLPRVEERAKNSFKAEVSKTIMGYTSVVPVNEYAQITRSSAQYALLPVYLLSTKWNGKSFLFAMNGQTGKFIGDLPVDKKKYWTWFAGIALPIIAILLGFWML